MIPEFEATICTRIPVPVKTEIDKLVASGKYKSVSELVRKALQEFVKNEAANG